MSEETSEVAVDSGDVQQESSNSQIFGTNTPIGAEGTEVKEADWYYADGIPGQGDKPEYFNDKTFKTLSEQAKAQGELRKKLGGFTGAPEQYDLVIPEKYSDMEVSDEDPLLTGFAAKAAEMNMSQDKFNEVVGMFLDHNAEMNTNMEEQKTEAHEAAKQEVFKELGPNHAEEVKKLDNFITSNFSDGTANEFKSLMNQSNDIKSIRAFQELFDKLNNRKVVSQATTQAPMYSRDDFRRDMSDKKWTGGDQNYRREILSKAKEAGLTM